MKNEKNEKKIIFEEARTRFVRLTKAGQRKRIIGIAVGEGSGNLAGACPMV